mmetsp:Transcript_26336/g.73954  ORF Transcript_26336/g.73954 Transcript_26336/m.73954 type:complete len:226 (-) Transcript_26336:444-1121(-)
MQRTSTSRSVRFRIRPTSALLNTMPPPSSAPYAVCFATSVMLATKPPCASESAPNSSRMMVPKASTSAHLGSEGAAGAACLSRWLSCCCTCAAICATTSEEAWPKSFEPLLTLAALRAPVAPAFACPACSREARDKMRAGSNPPILAVTRGASRRKTRWMPRRRCTTPRQCKYSRAKAMSSAMFRRPRPLPGSSCGCRRTLSSTSKGTSGGSDTISSLRPSKATP